MTNEDFRAMKQWEQLDVEIEFWSDMVSGGCDNKRIDVFPLCSWHIFNNCKECPLHVFIGDYCSSGTPYSKWLRNKCVETAQAMVDRLVEIRNKLHRLDK